MPIAENHGLRIHYEVHGGGRPVVLLHGGTVSFQHNYADFGWIQSLTEAGFRVVGIDFRGHGKSDKPHDVGSYGTAKLAGDVIAVLDRLGVQRVSLIAYSLGTAVALRLMQMLPERFDKAALVATGDGLIGHLPYTLARVVPPLGRVLGRTEYPSDLPATLGAYWNFIVATGADTRAMLAFSQAEYPPLSVEDAGAISTPTLVVSGQNDVVLGRGPRLAKALGRGEYLEIEGADHFSLAQDAGARTAVTTFLRYPV